MRRARPLVLVALVALASACASLPQAPLESGDFVVTGRVAVRYGNDAASGRVEWLHTAATDDLTISSPLGQGIAEIKRRGGEYLLVTANDQRYRAADPEQLTEQALGWALPLAGLPDWLRGRAAPGAPAETQTADGRLALLKQQGWTIEYLAYDEANQLPRRLRMVRGDLDIRLAIEDWRLGPP
jgi:outer membrane lipoprotein LolB